MKLPQAQVSRRNFLQSASAASLALGLRGPAVKAQQPPQAAGLVMLNGNEFYEGPIPAAAEAACERVMQGNRYFRDEADRLRDALCATLHVRPERVALYPGSGDLLQLATTAFTSPTKSLVCADPTFEVAPRQALANGAKVHAIPLTAEYAHDVKAMVAADPNAGFYYLCNPNNPTGTVTPRRDIEWAHRNKPAGSILLIDEAYIHFSNAESVLDLANTQTDVIVLRTFSKIYAMAGLRCGFAVGHPDLLARMKLLSVNILPSPAVIAAEISLRDPALVQTRKIAIAETRAELFEWLTLHRFGFISSDSNHFLRDMRLPSRRAMVVMEEQGISIGRGWASKPTHCRITIGSRQDMKLFRQALLNGRTDESHP
jgi:histidinol-phosphate aminotransferase